MSRLSLARTPLVLAIAFSFATAEATPLAQEGSDPQHGETTQLDEIVVTASPLRATADELSEPVEVLAGERLEADRAATLGETVSGLPGVQTSY